MRCRHCGTSFVSAHEGRRSELREQPGLELRERCPHCAGVDHYRAADYELGRLVGPREPLAG